VPCPNLFAYTWSQFHRDIYSLKKPRLGSLSVQSLKNFSKLEQNKGDNNQKDEFCTNLPVFNHVGIIRAALRPWLDDCIAKQPDCLVNDEKYEKAYDDIVKGAHFY